MSIELLAQLVIGLNTLAIFVLGIYQWKKPRAKPTSEVRVDDAGAAKQITEAWRPLVDSLQSQLIELRRGREEDNREISSLRANQTIQATELDGLRLSVRELRRGAFLLVGQLEKVGLTPVWRPELEKL